MSKRFQISFVLSDKENKFYHFDADWIRDSFYNVGLFNALGGVDNLIITEIPENEICPYCNNVVCKGDVR